MVRPTSSRHLHRMHSAPCVVSSVARVLQLTVERTSAELRAIEQQNPPVLRGALAIKRLKGMPDATCLEMKGLRAPRS